MSEVFCNGTSGRAVRAGLTAAGNAQNVDIARTATASSSKVWDKHRPPPSS
ncbi:hypothetical protein [Kitasatospora purpeofusca]|uniref:hypothetical protein n=1 Tax=Kitasatospora purpeofusca TaxID=67352 RepID=UPI00365857CC